MAHRSVLLHEVIEFLQPKSGGVFLDATYGGGGHSRALGVAIGRRGQLIACDRDRSVFTEAAIAEQARHTRFAHVVADFRDSARVVRDQGVESLDGAIFDLGLSSTQLEASGRGFSFQRDEPLLMTFREEPEAGDVTAEYVVNHWSEEHLVDILRGFGEERFARSIAKHIVTARKSGPIRSTGELVEVIHQAVPLRYQHGRTHFATRTFQALRMAVNDELGAIEGGIRGIIPILKSGGRLVVITFHSIEDRLVKRLFRELAREKGVVREVTKKPVVPTRQECIENPRARSAKLRVVEKSSNNT